MSNYPRFRGRVPCQHHHPTNAENERSFLTAVGPFPVLPSKNERNCSFSRAVGSSTQPPPKTSKYTRFRRWLVRFHIPARFQRDHDKLRVLFQHHYPTTAENEQLRSFSTAACPFPHTPSFSTQPHGPFAPTRENERVDFFSVYIKLFLF